MNSDYYAIILALVIIVAAAGCDRKRHEKPDDSAGVVTEAWWVYMAEYDGLPGSTMVNLAYGREAALDGYGIVVMTGVDYTPDPEKKGLPTDEELSVIQELRHKRTALFESMGGIDVGFFLNDKQERHYTYFRNAAGVEAALKDLYQKECPTRPPSIKVKTDPQWEVYRDFLLPNRATVEHYRAELTRMGAIKLLE